MVKMQDIISFHTISFQTSPPAYHFIFDHFYRRLEEIEEKFIENFFFKYSSVKRVSKPRINKRKLKIPLRNG